MRYLCSPADKMAWQLNVDVVECSPECVSVEYLSLTVVEQNDNR